MKKAYEFLFTTLSLLLISCNSAVSSSISDSTSSYPESKEGESYTSFTSIDYISNIDLPYFENTGDEQTMLVGGKHTTSVLRGKYIYYKTSENMTKCRDLIKSSNLHLDTKTNSETISNATLEKEVVYKDGYYYFINYVTRSSSANVPYETSVSVPYLTFDYTDTYLQNVSRVAAFPFIAQIDNETKDLKNNDSLSLSYTYSQLNDLNIIQKFDFSSYKTIKEYYQTINQDYIVSYDDSNKKIELRSCTYQLNAIYELGNSKAVITCSDTGITLDVTITS